MITHAVVDMAADGAIVCTDDAIAKDNTELVFDRDCHDIQRGRGLAWCGSPGVARLAWLATVHLSFSYAWDSAKLVPSLHTNLSVGLAFVGTTVRTVS
jgi:hypothetical protein